MPRRRDTLFIGTRIDPDEQVAVSVLNAVVTKSLNRKRSIRRARPLHLQTDLELRENLRDLTRHLSRQHDLFLGTSGAERVDDLAQIDRLNREGLNVVLAIGCRFQFWRLPQLSQPVTPGRSRRQHERREQHRLEQAAIGGRLMSRHEGCL